MKKKENKVDKYSKKVVDKLIDVVDSDIPYGAFCAILARIYWAL